MSQNKEYFEQSGLILSTGNGQVKVSIQGAGCSACHKSLCMLGDSKAKELEIMVHDNAFNTGDEVIVRISPSSGYTAVGMLYLVPFLFMITTLWVLTTLRYTEFIAGLSSLMILIPYFSIVFLMRKRLHHKCEIGLIKK